MSSSAIALVVEGGADAPVPDGAEAPGEGYLRPRRRWVTVGPSLSTRGGLGPGSAQGG